MTIEEHPLQPFLPKNGRMLFLGSFPPPKARWSMEWFYPNWINDFWRIQGFIHFDDKNYFEVKGEKRFDKERIVSFCEEKGMAFFDTARKVCRLKDNADDNFLEILEPTDVFALLDQMPSCSVVVTTGGKASEEICCYFNSQGIKVKVPRVGESVSINSDRWNGVWWRMPSSSRAYPMKLEKKADYYRLLSF
jgi:G:T/U-mismatch repair DNA glycosylase